MFDPVSMAEAWPGRCRPDFLELISDGNMSRFNGRSMAGSMLTSTASAGDVTALNVSMAEAWPGRC